mgnify:CR=1 FL=1
MDLISGAELMRGAIALLAVLYGARGEYPCAKEGVTNCSAVTYDDPSAGGETPTTDDVL